MICEVDEAEPSVLESFCRIGNCVDNDVGDTVCKHVMKKMSDNMGKRYLLNMPSPFFLGTKQKNSKKSFRKGLGSFLPACFLSSSRISALVFDLGMFPRNRRVFATETFTFRAFPGKISCPSY